MTLEGPNNVLNFCFWITWKEAATDSAFDPVSSKKEKKREEDDCRLNWLNKHTVSSAAKKQFDKFAKFGEAETPQ